MTDLDAFDVRLARSATGALRTFNEAGVLAAADVHVALRLARLGADGDSEVALAAALAVRAPRLGHVFVDLATIRDTAAVETEEADDLSALPWPEPAGWAARVATSGLAAAGDHDGGPSRPLRLVGSRLYLDRYWREERQVAADLRALAEAEPDAIDAGALTAALARLFGAEPDDGRQSLAATCAVRCRFSVVAGGPGTGKTTTVARIVALLAEQGGPPFPLVALAAPTGKAAARLEESVHAEAAGLDVDAAVRAGLSDLRASTLHRLLGWRPGSHSRFRHHRGNRLPHDVVIVDETSMVSLSLMGRLIEAVRPQARLVLVGDPDQLTSIEAGAVLGDIVGPAADEARPDAAVGRGIVVLHRVHRFGGGIARLATAVRRGDADAVVETLKEAPEGVTWIGVDVADPGADTHLAPVRDRAVAAGRAVTEAARQGAAREALTALGAFRVLCAHRRGDHGVATWMARIEGWLAGAVGDLGLAGRWYAGRPLLVTENDYGLRLYNGDTGVVVADAAGRLSAAFDRRGSVVEVRPSRIGAVDTVYAMTIHKSQGSQFGCAAVLLPTPTSRILTRELLYTAVTRAQEQLILVGTEATIRAAVERPVARASGLRDRLWSPSSA